MLVDLLKQEINSASSLHLAKTEEVASVLKRSGINCDGISSDLKQDERGRDAQISSTRFLFSLQLMWFLRIDIDNIEIVINYDVPPNEEDYVHKLTNCKSSKSGEAYTRSFS